jgi:hypothetical protein
MGSDEIVEHNVLISIPIGQMHLGHFDDALG